jgi:hypothetical protein
MTNIAFEFTTLPSRQVLQANSFGFFAYPAFGGPIRQIEAAGWVSGEY